jgi:phage terminase Nu1 subunit (DNA packaging protein)
MSSNQKPFMNKNETSNADCRWNDYAVWRQQHSTSVCERWTLTGHKLKAQSDKDAQSRLRRVFNGCGFTHMSLIAMPVGETPNEKS